MTPLHEVQNFLSASYRHDETNRLPEMRHRRYGTARERIGLVQYRDGLAQVIAPGMVAPGMVAQLIGVRNKIGGARNKEGGAKNKEGPRSLSRTNGLLGI